MIRTFFNMDNAKEDFWLHRYSNANFLEKMFSNGALNLKFTKAINFEDPLEGWDLRNPKIKKGMDETIAFYNRGIDDSCTIENLSGILSFFTDTRLDVLKNIVLKLKNYNENRNSTFISSWFKTDTIEEENRAMWRLYGNNEEGVRISVKWSDLKQALLKFNENFEVGLVDYGMNTKQQNLFFTKDISYKHENEFRILFYNKKAIEDQFIKLDNLKVHTTVRSMYNKDCYTNRLKKLGLEKGFDTNNKLTYDESHLFYESKQVDWSVVLDIINREILRNK